MEALFTGIVVGFVLGALLVSFLWNESVKSENE